MSSVCSPLSSHAVAGEHGGADTSLQKANHQAAGTSRASPPGSKTLELRLNVLHNYESGHIPPGPLRYPGRALSGGLSAYKHIELPIEHDPAIHLGSQCFGIEVSAEDPVATSVRQAALLPLLGIYLWRATSVEDHDLRGNTVCLGEKRLTLARKEQTIEVGDEEAPNGMRVQR